MIRVGEWFEGVLVAAAVLAMGMLGVMVPAFFMYLASVEDAAPKKPPLPLCEDVDMLVKEWRFSAAVSRANGWHAEAQMWERVAEEDAKKPCTGPRLEETE